MLKLNTIGCVTGLTPLMVATEKGHEEALATLMKVGADVNAEDYAGMGVVARAKTNTLLKFLLSAGADLDHRDSSGQLSNAAFWKTTHHMIQMISHSRCKIVQSDRRVCYICFASMSTCAIEQHTPLL